MSLVLLSGMSSHDLVGSGILFLLLYKGSDIPSERPSDCNLGWDQVGRKCNCRFIKHYVSPFLAAVNSRPPKSSCMLVETNQHTFTTNLQNSNAMLIMVRPRVNTVASIVGGAFLNKGRRDNCESLGLAYVSCFQPLIQQYGSSSRETALPTTFSL